MVSLKYFNGRYIHFLETVLYLSEYWKILHKNDPYCVNSGDGSGSHPLFGIAIISPVIISTLLTLLQWWNIEANTKNRLVTFPIVLCQCWPQYRSMRILYFGLWKKISQWKDELELQKKNVGSLGDFEF